MVTQNQVFACAANLHAERKRVTVRAVRAALYRGGSFGDIAPFVRE